MYFHLSVGLGFEMANVRIRELIEESRKVGRKVTQTDLAEAAGVAQQTIARLANNQRKRLDPVMLQAIADTFTKALNRKITISDLILSDDETETPDHSQPPDEPPPEPRTIDDEVLRAIEHLENRVDKGFAEVTDQIAELRTKISQ